MDNRKSSLWRHGWRYVSAVKDKRFRYWMITLRGFAVIALLLATSGWIAPVAVVAAPTTPTSGATFDILWLEGGNCLPPPPEPVAALNHAAGL